MTLRAAALAAALLCSFSALADEPPADATEDLLAVHLDGREVIGTALITRSADGDVWLEAAEWAKLEGVDLDLAGKTGLVSARSLGLEPTFDAAKQAVVLKVPAGKRPTQNLAKPLRRVVEVNPQPKGVLVNYDLAGRWHQASGEAVSLGHEARVGVGPATLSTLGQLNHARGKTTYTRGLTTVSYDHLEKGIAVQAGDVFTARTTLSGAVNLGGVRVGTDRALRRDRSFLPVPTLGGVVQQGTTAEIFVNGDRVGTHGVEPGPWQLDRYAALPGDNRVRVVLRDDFGREEVLEERFYLAPGALPQGATEWEVAVGKVRQQGDDYGAVAATGALERGMSDRWTLGASVQATRDAQQVAVGNRWSGRAGTLAVDAAASRSPEGSGTAVGLSYGYKARDWSVQAGHTRYSDDHWSLADERGPLYSTDSRRLASTSTLTLSVNPRGQPWNVGVGAAQLAFADGTTRSRLDAFGRYRRGVDEFGAGVGYSPDQGTTGYLTWRRSFGATSAQVSARKAPEFELDARANGRGTLAGKPLRWSAGLNHRERGDRAWAQASMGTTKGSLAVAGAYGADGRSEAQARFQGSVWVGEGGVAFQRASPGAFLVVEVEGQKGVPVSAGTGFASTTNGRGVAVVPNVQPLARHTVTVDGRDLPIDVGLDTTRQTAAVGRRAGGKVEFSVLSEHMVELRVSKDGVPLGPPLQAVSDTETALVGIGGAVVLLKPEPGQELRVGDACRVRLPDTLPGFETILNLECAP